VKRADEVRSPAPAATLFEVEREARWRIWALFGLLILVVWLSLLPVALLAAVFTHDVLGIDPLPGSWAPSSSRTLVETFVWMLVLGLLISLATWATSQRRARERLLKVLHAEPLDPRDSYHKRLWHVVDESRIAAGLPALSCFVVPGPAMNAFTFADRRGPACIGVTEGALSRLSRQQLQAVVAHEIAHVASRDCVTTTRACLLFNVHTALSRWLEKPRPVRRWPMLGALLLSSERGGSALDYMPTEKELGHDVQTSSFVAFVLWLVVGAMELAGTVVKLAISRQREYAADLAAARYTRDPVSLAEALQTMGRHRGGAGPIPAGLSPLCIRPAQVSGLEAGGRWLATHPPLAARIERLLALAREQGGDPQERAARLAARQRSREHVALPPGTRTQALDGLVAAATATDSGCPVCGGALRQVVYEGAAILACPECGGRAATHAQVDAILSRREMGFTPDQERLADIYEQEQKRLASLFEGPLAGPQARDTPPLTQPQATPIACPRCADTMDRGVWNALYPLAVDRCEKCRLVWFDRDELEVLQILVERQTS